MTTNRYVTLYLAGIIILVFAIQNIFSVDLAWTVGVLEIQFFTSLVAHGSMAHLLGNLFGLVVFGLILEETIGTKHYVMILAGAGIVGNLAGIGSYMRVLGTSGAIYGIFGALAVLRPKMVVWVSGLPMPMILAALAWTFVDVIGLFANTSTGHLAHLAGAIVGVGAGLYLREPKQGMPKKPTLTASQKQHLDAALDNWERSFMK